MIKECTVSSRLSPENDITNLPRPVNTTPMLDAVPLLSLPPIILSSNDDCCVSSSRSPSHSLPSKLQLAAHTHFPRDRRSIPASSSPQSDAIPPSSKNIDKRVVVWGQDAV